MENKMHTGRLLIMAALHFLIMYVAMYSMVNIFDNVLFNINQVYMAAIMTAPMLILEVLLMGQMYSDKKALTTIFMVSIFMLVAAFTFIRQQKFIGNKEFIRSMVPHHSGAILMCERAQISDSELRNLCVSIIRSQQSEIDQMKSILTRL